MATSGSFNTSTVSYIYQREISPGFYENITIETFFQVAWVAVPDINNRRWKITTTLTQKNTPTGWTRTISNRTLRIGKTASSYSTYSGSSQYSGSNNQRVPFEVSNANVTQITHYLPVENDGSCTLYLYANVGVGGTNPDNSTGYRSGIALDRMALVSTLDITDNGSNELYSEDVCDLTVHQALATNYSIVYIKAFSGAEYEEIYRGGGNTELSSSFEMPVGAFNGTSETANMWFKVETYDNDSYSGDMLENVIEKAVHFPRTWQPVATIGTITENNPRIPNGFPFIQGYSMLKIPVTYSREDNVDPAYGKTWQVEQNGVLADEWHNSSLLVNNHLFELLTPISEIVNTIEAKIINSRGRSDVDTAVVNAAPYEMPTLNIELSRVDVDGNDDPVGTYLSVKASWVYSSIQNNNNANISFTYGGTPYTYNTQSVYAQNTLVEIARISGISSTDVISFDVSLTDVLNNVTVTAYLGKSEVPFSTYDNGTDVGVTIGLAANLPGFRLTEKMFNQGNLFTYFNKVLWQNSSPTSSFAAQSITLNDSDYDFYEIIFNQSTSVDYYMSTGKLPKGHGTRLTAMFIATGGSGGRTRIVDYTDDTHLNVQVGRICNAGQTTVSNDNTACIPIAILGYKGTPLT